MIKEIEITSTRKFGIELEVGCENGDNFQNGVRFAEMQKGFESHHDGSIKGFNYCTEIVSPPLIAQEGLNQLNLIVDKLIENKFKVNESTGFHVHLDATDLLSDFEKIIVPVKDLYETFNKQKLEKVIIIPETLIKQRQPNITSEFIEELSTNVRGNDSYYHFELTQDFQLYIHLSKQFPQLKYKRLNVENIVHFTQKTKEMTKKVDELNKEREKLRRIYHNIIEETSNRTGRTSYNLGRTEIIDTAIARGFEKEIERFWQLENSRAGANPEILKMLSESQVSDKDYALVIKRKEDHHDKLKALLGFYLVFNDIMTSFVPKDRRGNHYCKDLTTKYNFDEILKIKSYEDFDKVWYKTTNMTHVKQLKGNKYHESRYYMVNFHSLTKHKTIEIRSHSGTLNKRKIARWLLLHQTIFDKVVNDNNIMEFLAHCNEIKDFEAKTETFYKYLALDKVIEKELRERALRFNQEI
jgi:hypothetical protein